MFQSRVINKGILFSKDPGTLIGAQGPQMPQMAQDSPWKPKVQIGLKTQNPNNILNRSPTVSLDDAIDYGFFFISNRDD